MSKGMQIAGGATLVSLLLLWYAWSNLGAGASFAYFKNLHEFRSASAEYVGQHARVHGYVVTGSIQRDLAARSVRFRVQNDAPHAGGTPEGSLMVVYQGLETPDMFKDGAEVVVEGVLQAAGPDGEFHADKVMAKCPSKFEAAPSQQQAAF